MPKLKQKWRSKDMGDAQEELKNFKDMGEAKEEL